MSEDEWLELDEELPITEVWGELGIEQPTLELIKLDYASRLSALFRGLFALIVSVAVLGGVVAHSAKADIEVWVWVAIGVCSVPFALLSLEGGTYHLIDLERRLLVFKRRVIGFDFSRPLLGFDRIAGFAVRSTQTREDGGIYYEHRLVVISTSGVPFNLGHLEENLRLLNRSAEELARLTGTKHWPGQRDGTLTISGQGPELRVEYPGA